MNSAGSPIFHKLVLREPGSVPRQPLAVWPVIFRGLAAIKASQLPKLTWKARLLASVCSATVSPEAPQAPVHPQLCDAHYKANKVIHTN